jgi:hypothetical protein
MLVVLFWRAGSFCKRGIILGCAVLVSGLWAAVVVLVLSHGAGGASRQGIGIRREGDRFFAAGRRSGIAA